MSPIFLYKKTEIDRPEIIQRKTAISYAGFCPNTRSKQPTFELATMCFYVADASRHTYEGSCSHPEHKLRAGGIYRDLLFNAPYYCSGCYKSPPNHKDNYSDTLYCYQCVKSAEPSTCCAHHGFEALRQIKLREEDLREYNRKCPYRFSVNQEPTPELFVSMNGYMVPVDRLFFKNEAGNFIQIPLSSLTPALPQVQPQPRPPSGNRRCERPATDSDYTSTKNTCCDGCKKNIKTTHFDFCKSCGLDVCLDCSKFRNNHAKTTGHSFHRVAFPTVLCGICHNTCGFDHYDPQCAGYVCDYVGAGDGHSKACDWIICKNCKGKEKDTHWKNQHKGHSFAIVRGGHQ